MGKLPRKEIKAYRSLVKRYRKRLKKLAKEWRPFDWSFATEMFMVCIEGMRDYYKEGNNVWAYETEGMPTREQMCNYILEKYEEYYKADFKDEFYRWDEMWRLVSGYMLELWD